jgi:hypothetical protein
VIRRGPSGLGELELTEYASINKVVPSRLPTVEACLGAISSLLEMAIYQEKVEKFSGVPGLRH